MDFLKKIEKKQRLKLISLPYRVGLWVSQSDATGGAEADREEAIALENILTGFARDVFGSEAVHYIMEQTILHKAQWPEWGHDLDRVPEECEEALGILADRIDPKEVSAFKQRLMEIAEAVALAFREYDKKSPPEKLRIYLLYYWKVLQARWNNQDFMPLQRYLNISMQEQQALKRLSNSLQIHYSAGTLSF